MIKIAEMAREIEGLKEQNRILQEGRAHFEEEIRRAHLQIKILRDGKGATEMELESMPDRQILKEIMSKLGSKTNNKKANGNWICKNFLGETWIQEANKFTIVRAATLVRDGEEVFAQDQGFEPGIAYRSEGIKWIKLTGITTREGDLTNVNYVKLMKPVAIKRVGFTGNGIVSTHSKHNLDWEWSVGKTSMIEKNSWKWFKNRTVRNRMLQFRVTGERTVVTETVDYEVYEAETVSGKILIRKHPLIQQMIEYGDDRVFTSNIKRQLVCANNRDFHEKTAICYMSNNSIIYSPRSKDEYVVRQKLGCVTNNHPPAAELKVKTQKIQRNQKEVVEVEKTSQKNPGRAVEKNVELTQQPVVDQKQVTSNQQPPTGKDTRKRSIKPRANKHNPDTKFKT